MPKENKPVQDLEFALGPNLKVLAVPLGSLVVLIVLVIIFFQFTLAKISSQSEEINKTKKEENVLNSKIALLSEAEDSITNQSEALSLYLPSKNSSLSIISQIKNGASLNLVSAENIKVGVENKTGSLSKVDINFDIDGSVPAILSYLKSFKTSMPITIFSKIKITGSGEMVRASITITGFWSPLLTKIPAITEPIKELTPDEITLIEKISTYTRPTFSEVLPTNPQPRSNPFN